jgi:hypothetical protein
VPASVAASRSTGSTPTPSVTCAPTWCCPRICARSARFPPATSPKPWTSWAARPRWSPGPQLPGRGPGRHALGRQGHRRRAASPRDRRRTARAVRRRPGRGRGAPAAPGVRAGVGRFAVQRWPLGAGDAAGRRWRGAACLSGCPVGAGELGADRGGGATGGGVHALRLRPPGGRRRGEAVLAGAPSWLVSRRSSPSMPAPSSLVRARGWSTVSRSSPPHSTQDGCPRRPAGTTVRLAPRPAPVGPSSRWHDKEP